MEGSRGFIPQKDPMRDSLLSSDYEIDPDSSQPGTPVEGSSNLSTNSNQTVTESNIDAIDALSKGISWIQCGAADEEAWEGVGESQAVVTRQTNALLFQDDEVEEGELSPEIVDPEDAGQQDLVGQQELEFDYWQGQFQFSSPALQDYPFIPICILEKLVGNSDDRVVRKGNVICKDLLNTVKILQSKVEVLGDSQSDSTDRIVRVKQDNSVLQARVVMLEEQLRETEHRGEERLAEEQRRNKELILRIEREKSLTVENYAIKQANTEKTNERLEEELQRLKAKVSRVQRERYDLDDRVLHAEQTAAQLLEENQRMAGVTKKELKDDQERSATVIEELRAEVERLSAVLDSSARKRLPSTDSTTNTDHLTASLRGLRDENKGLVEQVEELQAQLLTKGVEQGRDLVSIGGHNNSLAAEFDAMTQEEAAQAAVDKVQELQKSLRDSQDVNKHLRTYIDGILLTIVENHPQLLEVKAKPSSRSDTHRKSKV